MMFLCSVASELSTYDRALSVGAFMRINTLVILLGDVIRGKLWVVQAEIEGWKEICENVTNVSQNVCLWRVNMLCNCQ